MEEMFDNYASQMLAENTMLQLRLDESKTTSHEKMQTFLDEMERLRRRCGKDIQSDARMIRLITEAVSGVDWAHLTMRNYLMKHERERNFEDLRGFLLHAAMDDDRMNSRSSDSTAAGTYFTDGNRARGYENRRTAYPPRQNDGDRSAPPRRQNFGNRPNFKRFGRFVSSSRTQSNWKQNPIDRATGKPMVCRSKGCGSTSHFQFSGRCPIQKQRMQSGTQAAYMADCMDCDPDLCCKEILYSALQDAADAPTTPSPEADPAPEHPHGEDIFDTSDGYDEHGHWVMSNEATLDPFPTEWCDTPADAAVNFLTELDEEDEEDEQDGGEEETRLDSRSKDATTQKGDDGDKDRNAKEDEKSGSEIQRCYHFLFWFGDAS